MINNKINPVRKIKIGYIIFIILWLLFLSQVVISHATQGDIYAKGTVYNAATYQTHPSYFKHTDKLNVVDLNVGSGSYDCGMELYAPESGGVVTKRYINDSGWGNAITWEKGSVEIFFAHLSQFGATGLVNGGDVIGYVGTTGVSTNCHLHIESNQGRLVLSGNQIVPEFWYNGPAYTSQGPIDNTLVGFAKVSQESSILPNPVILGQDFTVQFKLKETAGAPITYEKIGIAILKSDGTHLFDIETYDDITIFANNTWSQSATDQIYLSSEAGNYKAVIRGKVSGGEWFDFQTVDGGVNPTNFSAVKPTAGIPPSINIPLNDSDGNYTVIWGESSTSGVNYVLEEATNSSFTSNLRTAYSATGTSAAINGRTNSNIYYYRVKATKAEHIDSDWKAGSNGCEIFGPPVLSVTPVDVEISSGSDTTSFSVSNTGKGTMAWTASVTSGNSWLAIISGSSGTDSGIIDCLYNANTEEFSRTATIKVDAPGAINSPMHIMVTQTASIPVLFAVTYHGNGNDSGFPPVDSNEYKEGDFVTVSENYGNLGKTGFVFDGWKDGNGENKKVGSTFAMPAGNIDLYGQWRILSYMVTYSAGYNGEITGNSHQQVTYGNNSDEVTATPDQGYHFVSWSDGSTLNPRKDENATGNITVTAIFAKDNIDYVYTNFNEVGIVMYSTFELESNDFKAIFHEVRVGEVYNADPEEDFVLYPPYALSMSNYYEGYSGPTKISFSKPATFVRGHVRGAWFESGWFEAEAYVTAWDEEDKLIDTYAVPNDFHGVFEFRGQIARIELLNSHSNDTVAVLNDFYAESDSNITDYPVLGVSPENQSVSEYPGSISFGVSNTGNGTLVWIAAVVSGDDWISITDGSSGTNAGTITCEYEANTGPSPRTAVIRITATDGSGSPMDVTITQSATISFDMNETFDALRVISGQVADIDLDKDINADGKIGISEAIYSLQDVSDTNEKNYHCGAYVAPAVWKEFDCYNLAAIGKVTKDDPFTPSWRLIGGYWQWGQKGPDPSQRYNTNAAKFAHGPIGPGSNEANDVSISGWDSYDAPDDTWSDSYKTDSDPCPIGFRVPTKAQWQGVLDNNTLSTVGTWSTMWDDHNNYSSARFFGSDLMLPAAGIRNGYGGALRDRGRSGSYWSSSQYSSSHAWYPYFGSGHVGTTNGYRRIGRSVRCVAE
jgi:uncharacterized protein (TIGR02145 family)/uncharacterized repeat protein (TIGR02543 family)